MNLEQLQTAKEAADGTISHYDLMEKLKPKFLSGLNKEINRAKENAQIKLVYTKGMYPKDVLLHSMQEIRDLGYTIILDEEQTNVDGTKVPETLTIQWKEDENESVN